MAFNIHDFKSRGLALNGARPSLFSVDIPQGWPRADGSNSQVPYMAKASSLPQSTINEVEVGYFGRKIKLAGDRTYANWACTFYNDESFSIRNGMLNWHQYINSTVPNLMGGPEPVSPESYKSDITITQWSKAGEGNAPTALFTCTLIGAFPVIIGPITLDWDATNQIEMFDAEFAYDYWIAGKTFPDSGQLNSTSNYLTVPAATVPSTLSIPQ